MVLFSSKIYLKYIKRKLHKVLNIKAKFQKSYLKKYKSFPKTILLTRQDNLGDAFICLPFFKSLSEIADITILSSKYNDIVLSPFFKTVITNDLKENKFDKNFYKNLGKFDVFCELIGKSIILKIATSLKGINFKYIIGFKLPIATFLADYSYPFSFSYARKSIVGIYYDEVEKALGVPLKRYDTFDFSNLKIKYKLNKKLFDISKNQIVFFLGVKKYRNLPVKIWENLLKLFIKKNFFFVLIDSKVDKIFNNFSKEFKALRGKKYFYYSIKSLEDLFRTYFSIKIAKLVIGVDSGPMHLFSYGINTFTIFTVNANFNVWAPYTIKPYTSINLFKDFLLKKSKKQDGSLKFILARNLPCLRLDTCIDCKERFCREIDYKKLFKTIFYILKRENLKSYSL